MIRRPPRSTRTDTLLPYTALFRSRAVSRRTQGKLLADHQFVQGMIADSALELERFRLLILKTAWMIDNQPHGAARMHIGMRTEERRGGKERVRTGRARWAPHPSKKKNHNTHTVPTHAITSTDQNTESIEQ